MSNISLELPGGVKVLNADPLDPRCKVSTKESIKNDPTYYVGFLPILEETTGKNLVISGGDSATGWSFAALGSGGSGITNVIYIDPISGDDTLETSNSYKTPHVALAAATPKKSIVVWLPGDYHYADVSWVWLEIDIPMYMWAGVRILVEVSNTPFKLDPTITEGTVSIKGNGSIYADENYYETIQVSRVILIKQDAKSTIDIDIEFDEVVSQLGGIFIKNIQNSSINLHIKHLQNVLDNEALWYQFCDNVNIQTKLDRLVLGDGIRDCEWADTAGIRLEALNLASLVDIEIGEAYMVHSSTNTLRTQLIRTGWHSSSSYFHYRIHNIDCNVVTTNCNIFQNLGGNNETTKIELGSVQSIGAVLMSATPANLHFKADKINTDSRILSATAGSIFEADFGVVESTYNDFLLVLNGATTSKILLAGLITTLAGALSITTSNIVGDYIADDLVLRTGVVESITSTNPQTLKVKRGLYTSGGISTNLILEYIYKQEESAVQIKTASFTAEPGIPYRLEGAGTIVITIPSSGGDRFSVVNGGDNGATITGLGELASSDGTVLYYDSTWKEYTNRLT